MASPSQVAQSEKTNVLYLKAWLCLNNVMKKKVLHHSVHCTVYINFEVTALKGTVQRKLTGVLSGINR
jgi:hypothetical protein